MWLCLRRGGGEVTGSGIACPGDCQEYYSPETEVWLTADPAQTFAFDQWTGDVASTANPLRLIMDEDKQVTAGFIGGGLTPTGSSYQVVLPPGSTVSKYQIVSVPVQPAQSDPESHIHFCGLDLGEDDPTLIRLGRWDPETGSYDEYPFEEEPGPGWAGWFLCRKGLTLNFRGSPTPVTEGPDGSLGYSLSLRKGWNQVGNPYTFTISLSETLVQGAGGYEALSAGTLTQGLFWIYENGQYFEAETLAPGQGGWVKLLADEGFIYYPAVEAGPAQDAAPKPVPDGIERPPDPPGALTSGSPGGGGCFIGGRPAVRFEALFFLRRAGRRAFAELTCSQNTFFDISS